MSIDSMTAPFAYAPRSQQRNLFARVIAGLRFVTEALAEGQAMRLVAGERFPAKCY